jgi:heat shock protein HslJ
MRKFTFLLLLLTACSTPSKKEKPEPITTQKVMGVYTGVTPCADCEGIYTKIEFIDSITFIKSSKYLGKSSRAFFDMGQWRIQNDSVLVTHAHGQQQQYLYENSGLIMLNQEGKRIKGALADYYRLTKGEPEGKKDRSNEVKAGIDFIARGNEPYWNLEIDFNGTLRFTTLESDSIVSKTTSPVIDGNTTQLQVSEGEKQLTVKFSPVGCINNMTGAYSDYAVEVNFNQGKLESGCGEFINSAYQISGTWQLASLNGEVAKTDDYAKELPELNFEAFTQKVSGYSGCNRLSGGYKADETGLFSFSPLATTRMMCEGKNKESAFLNALSAVSRYKLESDRLLLLKGEEVVAEFTSK